MSKIISIVGPTAVGKTDFAFQVAEKLIAEKKASGVDIISADSRQVYKSLEIVSGADIPEGFEPKTFSDWPDHATYFEKEKIRLFGLLILQPIEEWSVSQFQHYAQRVISMSHSQNRTVIVVGGTGLYQRHLFTTDPQLHIPPNLNIRQKAETMTVAEMQQWLNSIDTSHYQKMNESDKQNPRRLIRAIEIGIARQTEQPSPAQSLIEPKTAVTIGLIDSIEHISERIITRVGLRFSQGALQEVEKLVAEYGDQKVPIFSTTGVKPLSLLATGQISETECHEAWIRQERQYAKRQLTWWKKQTGVDWFSITDADWQTDALDTIETWYIR